MYIDRAVDHLIVCVGTFLHVEQLMPIGASDPTGMELVPNAASTLLTFVLLSVLTKWRPIRGSSRFMYFGEFAMRSMLELLVVVCSVEMLLIWLWIPLLVVLSEFCESAAEDYLETRMAKLMTDGFFIIRFLLAAILGATVAIFQYWFQARRTNNNNNNKNKNTTGHQQINGGQRAGPAGHNGRNGQVYDRPIIVVPGGEFTRNGNKRIAINGATLDDSSA